MLLSLEFCERNHKAAYYESKYELELQGNEGKDIGTRQTFSRIEEYAHVIYAIIIFLFTHVETKTLIS